MVLNIPKVLENDIKSFCEINKIEDINNFLVCCLRDGYNIAKYGTSPQENFINENKPLKIEKYETEEKSESKGVEGKEVKRRGRPKKKLTADEKISKPIEKEEESVKPKKKIRIISD